MGQPVAHHELVGELARGLRGRCGVGEGARLLVAVSGGGDSVALLRALGGLQEKRGWRLGLAVGHVQHHWHEEAEAHAAFVEALADRLELPFYRADLTGAGGQSVSPVETGEGSGAEAGGGTRGNLEAWARRERYRALVRLAGSAHADFIATAHQSDDQLETLLMRLLRGSSVTGLRGIAWRRRLKRGAADDGGAEEARERTRGEPLRLIRPLLGVSRNQARQFLRHIGQQWREDPTNASTERRRARLRQAVLPVLEDLEPGVAKKAVRLADHCREVEELVRDQANLYHERAVAERGAGGGAVVDRYEAKVMPRVVLGRILRRLLIEAGAPSDKLTKRTLTPLLAALRDRTGGERRFDLPGGVSAVVTRDELRIKAKGS
jgi:tRNA(Ile)-lysidine synthase